MRENGRDNLLTARRVEEYIELYERTPEDRQNPYFAPLIAGDLRHQPPTLVVTAELDPLRDEGEAYARRLSLAGNAAECHRLPDALHGYLSAMPPAPGGAALVRRTYGLIRAFWRAGRPRTRSTGNRRFDFVRKPPRAHSPFLWAGFVVPFTLKGGEPFA